MIKTLTLKRVSRTLDGTWGVLEYNGEPFALTGELPWIENKKNLSCIPDGSYKAKRTYSHKYGYVYLLQNVPNRGGILIHSGNVPTKDSRGCILIGEEFSRLDKTLAVVSSKRAYQEFQAIVNGDLIFLLQIFWTECKAIKI